MSNHLKFSFNVKNAAQNSPFKYQNARKNAVLLAILGSACAFSTASFAQHNKADETDTIVVTASRFDDKNAVKNALVSTISRQQIKDSPAQNLPEILASHGGINVRQTNAGILGKDASIDLRGFGETATSNTLILLDGLRLNPSDLGSVLWSSIPLESILRIEIIKGSGTVLYGDNATGGVINIITDKSGKFKANAAINVGSHQFRSTEAQLANGNNDAYFNAVFHHAKTDGERENGQQKEQSANLRAGLLFEKGELFINLTRYEDAAGLPGALLKKAWENDSKSARQPDDTEERKGVRVRPGFRFSPTETLTFEMEYGVDHQKLNADYFDSAYERIRDTKSLTPRARWQHGLFERASETILGFDYYNGQFEATSTRRASQNAKQQSRAFYVQNTTEIMPKLSLQIGGRQQKLHQKAEQSAYENLDFPWLSSDAMQGNSNNTKNAWDLMATYTEDAFSLFAKTGTNFRFANLDELFGFDPFTYAPVFSGNLRPQTGRTHEIGGKLKGANLNLRATFFQTQLQNEIAFDGTANANLPQTKREGVELEASWKALSNLNINSHYTFLRAQFKEGENQGKNIPLVPRHLASLQSVLDLGKMGRYSAALRYVGNQYGSGDFANLHEKLPAYTTLDTQAVWNIRPVKITAKINNLTDKKYASFGGYSAFNNDHYYYPANRRSFFVGAQYDF